MKKGSPARIFTNVAPVNQIELPLSEGYKYCKTCEKFTFDENFHCPECDICPSKVTLEYQKFEFKKFNIQSLFKRMGVHINIVSIVTDVSKRLMSIARDVNSVILAIIVKREDRTTKKQMNCY